MKQPCVYILTNKRNGTLYTGMSTNITQRLEQHKKADGFARKYGCTMLVFIEFFETIQEAYDAEKKIKSGSRKKKMALIESLNPDWNNLAETL